MTTTAIYPGSFDPVTNGHVDVVERGLELFDRIIVVILHNPQKTSLFSLEERVEMLQESLRGLGNIEVDTFHGLTVDYCVKHDAQAILRGMRAVSDFEYEFQLALMNRRIEREVETVFLMTGFRWIYISSSIIKDAARHGGDVSGLVPDHVCEKLREKFMMK